MAVCTTESVSSTADRFAKITQPTFLPLGRQWRFYCGVLWRVSFVLFCFPFWLFGLSPSVLSPTFSWRLTVVRQFVEGEKGERVTSLSFSWCETSPRLDHPAAAALSRLCAAICQLCWHWADKTEWWTWLAKLSSSPAPHLRSIDHIEVKLCLTFQVSDRRQQHLCRLSAGPFYLFGFFSCFLRKEKKKINGGGFRKTKTWTMNLLSHLVASEDFCIFCIFFCLPLFGFSSCLSTFPPHTIFFLSRGLLLWINKTRRRNPKMAAAWRN